MCISNHISPDPSDLERGDPYEGPHGGRTVSVDTQGRPFRDTVDGRQYITTPEVEEVAKYIHRLRGGGRIMINEADHMITVSDEGPVFLGILEGDSLDYEEQTKEEEVPEPFEEFINEGY